MRRMTRCSMRQCAISCISKGKSVEILANYEPSLHYVSEWWKQLYGESEGKDQKGIFPASVDLTTDLHSMGQFIQDGSAHHVRDCAECRESRPVNL